MIEMQIEDDRVERLRVQQMGEGWIQAVAEGAFDRLERYCLVDVTSRLLTPKRYSVFDNVTDLIDKYRQWFAACSHFRVQQSRVEQVGERLGIFYRFLLREQGEWFVVEQQLYGSLVNGQIADLQLLCSGFQPVGAVGASGQAAPMDQAAPVDQAALVNGEVNRGGAAEGSEIPMDDMPFSRDDVLELHTGAATHDATCALLTPAIRAKLREMQTGQVLEVRVDDPSAREDVESWCRLSGNPLLSIGAGPGTDLHFFIQKK